MAKSEWIWMPHAAHFCDASKCLFRLATYVQGFIISTVGEYINPLNEEGFISDIGYKRKYETYVFKAKPNNKINCGCAFMPGDWTELDSNSYNDAKSAYSGHIEMCEKYDSDNKRRVSDET